MAKVILKIEGMSCSACQNTLEKYLNKQDGVIEAKVNLVMAESSIEYDDKLTIDDLNRFVEEAGYKSLGKYNPMEEEKKDYNKIYLIILAFIGVFLMYVSMGSMLKLPVIPFLDMMKCPFNYGLCLVILTIPFLIYGFDILKSGFKKLVKRSPNMDSLVTVGLLASFIYSLVNLILVINGHHHLVHHLYFESCAMIIYFVKLGRFIDKKSKEKTKEAIKELVQITPEIALLKVGEEIKEVTIDEVKKGDVLVCKPGMKVAVDGFISKGEAHFDEAFITGETAKSRKGKNDKVIAGSLNMDGYVEYVAHKIGPDSTISEVVRLVVEATNSKAPIGYLADTISGYFVPGIFLISILTFIGYLLLGFSFNEALTAFVTVLVVACPCALGLATPLAIVVSEGASAKKGILIKSGEILENAHKVDSIIFDKTGTLTYGKLKVFKIINYSKFQDQEILEFVSDLEKNSTHPIAYAFKNYETKREVEKFKNIAGMGLEGVVQNHQIYVGNNKLLTKLKIQNAYEKEEKSLAKNECSIIYVIIDKEVVSLIGVKDIIRNNAKEVISSLQKMGKEIVILSGDSDEVAKKVARELKIDNVEANLLPQDKVAYLKDLNKKGKKVMMVGDGINDAPSLASALVGVSISGGTDIALNSASVILMNDNLEKIIDLINISKKTIKIIKENLFWAFIYNLFMIPIAMGLFKGFGLSINPMLASLSMVLSSLTVIFNSLRLRK